MGRSECFTPVQWARDAKGPLLTAKTASALRRLLRSPRRCTAVIACVNSPVSRVVPEPGGLVFWDVVAECQRVEG